MEEIKTQNQQVALYIIKQQKYLTLVSKSKLNFSSSVNLILCVPFKAMIIQKSILLKQPFS